MVTVPEWELPRCFNCFGEYHPPARCPDQFRNIFQKEELRERLGVINRPWTDYLLAPGHVIPPGIRVKHLAFRRIWTPYQTAASGRTVSPHAVPINLAAALAEVPAAAPTAALSGPAPSPEPSSKNPPVETKDCGSQTESPSCAELAVQTDVEEPKPTSCFGSQTDPPPPQPLMIDQAVQTLTRRLTPWLRAPRPAPASTLAPAPVPTPEPTPPPPPPEEESLITGKNHEQCWMCTKVHSPMDPCEATSQFNHGNSGWGESSWQEQLKTASLLYKPPGTRGLRHRSRKAGSLKTLGISNSRSIDHNTTAYRVENGEKEVTFGREDLTLLAKLDVEAVRCADRRPPVYDDFASETPASIDPSCHLNRCPNEILETIFTYAGDDYASDSGGKVKDIIAGHNFSLGDGVWDNVRRAHNLDGVARSCRRLRLVAQQIIYKVVCIDRYKPLRKLALALTADPELGELVQVFRITLSQTNQPYRNRGLFRYQMDRKTAVPNTDYASLFVRVVESCPNLQVVSAKMFGSVLGFGAIRGRFTKMREICISDPISSSLVLNRMWDHLVKFPRLTKFKIVHSDLNNAVDFTPLEIPLHMADRALENNFKHLATLTLENAPEVADSLLYFLARRLTALTKLAIVNCKLVSSAGMFVDVSGRGGRG